MTATIEPQGRSFIATILKQDVPVVSLPLHISVPHMAIAPNAIIQLPDR